MLYLGASDNHPTKVSSQRRDRNLPPHLVMVYRTSAPSFKQSFFSQPWGSPFLAYQYSFVFQAEWQQYSPSYSSIILKLMNHLAKGTTDIIPDKQISLNGSFRWDISSKSISNPYLMGAHAPKDRYANRQKMMFGTILPQSLGTDIYYHPSSQSAPLLFPQAKHTWIFQNKYVAIIHASSCYLQEITPMQNAWDGRIVFRP